MRNSLGFNYLFVSKHHPLHALFAGLYEDDSPPDSSEAAADIDPALTHGMAGRVWKDEKCKPNQK